MKKLIILASVFVFAIAFIAGLNASYIAVSSGWNGAYTPSVILDAGHGGVDGGAVADDGTVEKDLNLVITKKLKSILKLMGYNIVTTREEDISIHDSDADTIRSKKVSDLHNRLDLIEKNPGFLYIGIHQNKFPQKQYWGTQVFYGTQNEESQKLALSIQQDVREMLQPGNEREIKPSDKSIYILYNSPNPSALVECGFISNDEELGKLKDESYQGKLAFCIACGIAGYYETEYNNQNS